MEIKQLLNCKTDCLIQYLTPDGTDNSGWLGGNAPVWFDDKENLINNTENYSFFMAVKNPFDKNRMISIFLPCSFDSYNQNNIYPNCAVKVYEHEKSDESSFNKYIMLNKKSEPLFKKSFITKPELVNNPTPDEPFFIQTGGKPFMIQGSSHYTSKLDDDG